MSKKLIYSQEDLDLILSIEIQEYEEEIERLTELCNKYEEEHKTTFETWQKDIKENELLHSIIKEVREYIKSMTLYNNNKCDTGMKDYQCTHLLEILDKVEEK